MHSLLVVVEGIYTHENGRTKIFWNNGFLYKWILLNPVLAIFRS